MYPVTLGYTEATRRIQSLLGNSHSAEALLTAVFTLEKTVRRALKYMIVARGFTNLHAEVILGRRGFVELQALWPCFAPGGGSLPGLLGAPTWSVVKSSVEMRNKLVHGTRVYGLAECASNAGSVLQALGVLQNCPFSRDPDRHLV